MRYERLLQAVVLLLLGMGTAQAAPTKDCGQVTIVKVLTGPRHGSMMLVSNSSCGPYGGWVCLDPQGEKMTPEQSRRLFAFVLSMYIAGRPIDLTVYEDGAYATA